VIDGLPGRLAQIVDALRGEGFDVGLLGTGSGAIAPDELAAADLVLVTAADPARAEAVLRAIRAASPGELPVVVASAAPPAQDGRLLRAGADSVVAVAATHGELVQTVQAVLDGSLAPVPVPAT
jgi:DNA-binding response OmpR family regulator